MQKKVILSLARIKNCERKHLLKWLISFGIRSVMSAIDVLRTFEEVLFSIKLSGSQAIYTREQLSSDPLKKRFGRKILTMHFHGL